MQVLSSVLVDSRIDSGVNDSDAANHALLQFSKEVNPLLPDLEKGTEYGRCSLQYDSCHTCTSMSMPSRGAMD